MNARIWEPARISYHNLNGLRTSVGLYTVDKSKIDGNHIRSNKSIDIVGFHRTSRIKYHYIVYRLPPSEGKGKFHKMTLNLRWHFR